MTDHFVFDRISILGFAMCSKQEIRARQKSWGDNECPWIVNPPQLISHDTICVGQY